MKKEKKQEEWFQTPKKNFHAKKKKKKTSLFVACFFARVESLLFIPSSFISTTEMQHLVLDRDVRDWVLVPLTLCIALMMLMRQYATVSLKRSVFFFF